MTYAMLKTVHILSAAVLFGTGMGIAFFQFMAWRSRDAHVFAVVARLTVSADWLFTASAVVAQPVTGLWLVKGAGYAWNAPWLLASYALYLLAGAMWLPVVVMQIRIARLASDAVARAEPIPATAERLMRYWFWCGWPAFGAVIGTYWLMVAKPM